MTKNWRIASMVPLHFKIPFLCPTIPVFFMFFTEKLHVMGSTNIACMSSRLFFLLFDKRKAGGTQVLSKQLLVNFFRPHLNRLSFSAPPPTLLTQEHQCLAVQYLKNRFVAVFFALWHSPWALVNRCSYCERFEPRSHFKSRLSLIVRVNVVLNRTVIVDSDWRFDNLCGTSRRDVIGRLSVRPRCYWLWRLVISNWCVSIRLLSQLNSRLLLVKLSFSHCCFLSLFLSDMNFFARRRFSLACRILKDKQYVSLSTMRQGHQLGSLIPSTRPKFSLNPVIPRA